MALRNAFDGLATESGLRRIANLLTFARDTNDRLRVTVDNQVPATVYNRNTSQIVQGSTSSTWYNASSWSDRDGREEMMLQYKQRADFVKKNRWTY
jgi:hypothetical protein